MTLVQMRAGRGAIAALGLVAALATAIGFPSVERALGEDNWNPFQERDDSRPVRPRRDPAPQSSSPTQDLETYGQPGELPPLAQSGAGVERVELAPIEPAIPLEQTPPLPSQGPVDGGSIKRASPAHQSQSARGTPARPLDEKQVAALLSAGLIPNRSPTLTGLWYIALNGRSDLVPASEADLAVRVEALWQSGFPFEAARLLQSQRNSDSPLISALHGKTAIATGAAELGCPAIKSANDRRDALPKPVVAEILALAGYCGIINGNAAAAAAVADLMREQGIGDPDEVSLLSTAAAERKPDVAALRRLTPLGLRLAQRAGAELDPAIAKIATPATLALLSLEKDIPPATGIAASEAAAQLNIIPLDRLAAAYRRAGRPNASLPAPAASGLALAGRASLFVSAESAASPLQRTRHIRNFLDSARRDGLYLQGLLLAADLIERIEPAQEIGWFSETAIEVLVAAGHYERARRWQAFGGRHAQQGPRAFDTWLTLIELTDPTRTVRRGDELISLEEMAMQGRFASEALHRLATVLDALDYNVPVRLWEAASRTPQPNTGHLPATGVMKELQDASRTRDTDATAFLTIRTLGAAGSEGAHIIALGDGLRALRRAGLDAQARRVAFEALLAIWPRVAN